MNIYIKDNLNMGKKVNITQRQLHDIIQESISKILLESENTNSHLDDYGEEIPRNGQGYGVDDTLKNRQGYNEDGTKGPWFSRSVACATVVFLHDGNNWYVLGNRRGSGTPDYQGRWNVPCGYLDYNEDACDAAMREVREETGIHLSKENMMRLGQSSSPMENRQNVCFFYMTILNGSIDDFPFSTAEMEENEVSGIQWIPLNMVDNYKWAFWHNRLVKKAISKLNAFNAYEGTGNKSVASDIYNAINMLRNGEDTEKIIETLENALEDL